MRQIEQVRFITDSTLVVKAMNSYFKYELDLPNS